MSVQAVTSELYAEQWIRQHSDWQRYRNWKLCLSANEIQNVVEKLAMRLNVYYGQRASKEPVLIVGLLKGVYMFLADLTRMLHFSYTIGFLSVQTYADAQTPTKPRVESVGRLPQALEILVVDELFDSGTTLNAATEFLREQHPDATIKTCTLLAKNLCSEQQRLPDFVGVHGVPNVWLVGYGLDDQGTKRGWPHIFFTPKPLASNETPDRNEQLFYDIQHYLEVRRILEQKSRNAVFLNFAHQKDMRRV